MGLFVKALQPLREQLSVRGNACLNVLFLIIELIEGKRENLLMLARLGQIAHNHMVSIRAGLVRWI